MLIFQKKIFFLIIVLCFSLPIYAEPTEQAHSKQNQSEEKQYYIVEVILFRHLNKQGMQDEFWSRPEVTNTSDLSAGNDNQQQPSNDIPALAEFDLLSKQFSPLRNNIATLSANNYKLSESAAHLRYSKDYKLLAHFGWTQRSLSKQRALPILITAEQFSDSLLPTGELKLYVSRFLHMQVNLQASQCIYINTPEQASEVELTEQTGKHSNNEKLLANEADNTYSSENSAGNSDKNADILAYSADGPQDNSADQQCIKQVYQFKTNRKMRSRELHYLDNPVFGMLIYVTPFSTSNNSQ